MGCSAEYWSMYYGVNRFRI